MILTLTDIKKWVKALGSGRYKQGRGTLGDIDGTNCCLGVLCRTKRQKFNLFGDGTWDIGYESEDNTNDLYQEIRSALKVHNIDSNDLIVMNDGNESFKDIATYIWKKIKGKK